MIRPGSNKATNNNENYLSLKINLRLESLQEIETPLILDCFAGDSIIWNNVKTKTNKEFSRVTIDADSRYKTDYTCNALTFLKSNDITKFNIIDLDSWGSPSKYLDVIFKSNYKGIIICTYCSPVLMNPYKILAQNYYGNIYNSSTKKTLLNKDIGEMFKKYLFDNNVKQYKGLISSKKIYCSFKI